MQEIGGAVIAGILMPLLATVGVAILPWLVAEFAADDNDRSKRLHIVFPVWGTWTVTVLCQGAMGFRPVRAALPALLVMAPLFFL